MKEYIEFQLIERKPKTVIYSIRNINHGNEIGRIYWYGSCRQYIFEGGQNTIWSSDCLKKVTEFLLEINRIHKEYAR